MIEEGARLLGAMLQTEDPKEANRLFWKSLTEYCEANGLPTVFYCPYVPLQIVNANGETEIPDPLNIKSFKTRYGIVTTNKE